LGQRRKIVATIKAIEGRLEMHFYAMERIRQQRDEAWLELDAQKKEMKDVRWILDRDEPANVNLNRDSLRAAVDFHLSRLKDDKYRAIGERNRFRKQAEESARKLDLWEKAYRDLERIHSAKMRELGALPLKKPEGA
jgi:hypothetical protein